MRLRADDREQLAVNLRRAVNFRIRAPRAIEVAEEQGAEILPRLHELFKELIGKVLLALLRDALRLLPLRLYAFLDLDILPRHDHVHRVLEMRPDTLQRRPLCLAPAIIADELDNCHNHSYQSQDLPPGDAQFQRHCITANQQVKSLVQRTTPPLPLPPSARAAVHSCPARLHAFAQGRHHRGGHHARHPHPPMA